MKVKHIHIVDDNAISIIASAFKCFFLANDEDVEVSLSSIAEMENKVLHAESIIVLLSNADPSADIANTIANLRQTDSGTPILVLHREIMHAVDIKRISAFRNIAVASMGCSTIDLLELVNKVCQNPTHIVLCSVTQEHLLKHVLGSASMKVDKIKLNELEEQIVKAHEDGLSIKQTAEKLQLSPNTVAAYRSKMLKRAGVASMLRFVAQRHIS